MTEGKDTDITFAYDGCFVVWADLEDARPIAHGRCAAPSPPTVALAGMPVSSMAYLEQPNPAGYFIFPDLSVRHEGKYRLKFILMEDTKRMEDFDAVPTSAEAEAHVFDDDGPEGYYYARMDVKSGVFDVYSAKKFPGLATSTDLSKTISEQGCRVRIRRDVRMRRRGDGKGNDDYEDKFERQSRPQTVDYQRERSRSSSNGSRGDPLPYEPQPGGMLAFGGQQYQQAQPGFAPPPPPPQHHHYPPPIYHQPYSHPAPHPPPTPHYAYDRQTPYPQSAYPSTPAMRERVHEDEYRRQSMAGHQNEQFARYDAAPEQNLARPHQSFQYPRPPVAVSLPPIRSEFLGKFEPAQSLSSVRSVAQLSSPTYLRPDDLHNLYDQPSAPPAARNGKRSFDTTFGSASSKQPLFNGMRPSTPQHDDDNDAALMINMAYKRADGSEFTRALPTLQ